MLEEKIDIFNLPGNTDVDAICITTNLFVKQNGEAVMGRGVAKHYNDIGYGIPATVLGKMIKEGITVGIMGMIGKVNVVSFPVKPAYVICWPDKSDIVDHAKSKFNSGDIVPGFFGKAKISIIIESLCKLRELASIYKWKKILLPRPGCGAGELSWENEVKPYLIDMGFNNDKIIFVTL